MELGNRRGRQAPPHGNAVKVSRVRAHRRDPVALRDKNVGEDGGQDHGSLTMKAGAIYKFELA